MYRDPEGFLQTSERYAGDADESYTAESATAILGTLPVLHPAIPCELSKIDDTKYLLEFCELLIDAGLVDLETAKPQPVETFVAQYISEFKKQVSDMPTLHPKIQKKLEFDSSNLQKIKFAECLIDSGKMDLASLQPMSVTQFLKTYLNAFVEKHLGKLTCFEMEIKFQFGDVSDLIDEYGIEQEPDSFLMTIDNRPHNDLGDFVFDFDAQKAFLDQYDPKLIKTLFWIFKQFSPYVGGIGTAEWFCDDHPPSVMAVLISEEERELDEDIMYEYDSDKALKLFRKRATKAEADVVKTRNSVFAGESYKKIISVEPRIQPLLDHIRAMQQFIRREIKSGLWLDETLDQKYYPFFIPTVHAEGTLWDIIIEKNNSGSGDYCYLSTQTLYKMQPEFFEKFAVSLKAISMLDTCIHLLKQLPVPVQAN
ncbi:hypothetical protein [Flavobacterium sp.]|uniref:hypothetical protein n=1 Tax=Flavobacterium sp. TaxID=239 RepID=UPI0026139BC9|nr:hypothetical protein [Flavobacterium sp.]